MESPLEVKRLIEEAGGKIEECHRLPDDSGFAVASFPLPKDHWIYEDKANVPPAPYRIGSGKEINLTRTRENFADDIRAAARHAIRASTMNGKDMDFDPDAMVQNFIIGLLGYWTEDGQSDC